MGYIFQLGYVLIVLVMVVGISNAVGDTFDEEMRKFMDIYGKPNVDDQTKMEHLPYFVDFLYRYSDRIPADLKKHFEHLKSSLNIPDDDSEVLVDGVPIQGGRWGKAFKSAAKDVAVQTTSNVLTDFYQRVANWLG